MPPLRPWMKSLLFFAGGYNVLAGLGMICLYHEGFNLFGLAKPELKLPIQLVGLFVLLFGVGYFLVARDPMKNRNVLLLGFLSKLFGSIFGLAYVVTGDLPLVFVPLLLLSDIGGYLPPFLLILRRIDARSNREIPQTGSNGRRWSLFSYLKSGVGAGKHFEDPGMQAGY